jgi:ureidoglycolate hydrolase
MNERIEQGFMAFIAEGKEGIGAVRGVTPHSIVIYVENAGEFIVPMSAVRKVHDQKVILDRHLLDAALLAAIRRAHDSEDPKLAG